MNNKELKVIKEAIDNLQRDTMELFLKQYVHDIINECRELMELLNLLKSTTGKFNQELYYKLFDLRFKCHEFSFELNSMHLEKDEGYIFNKIDEFVKERNILLESYQKETEKILHEIEEVEMEDKDKKMLIDLLEEEEKKSKKFEIPMFR
jgi:single-stranded DNA-specific DHH superfamily exonuclease